jgi:hypothetical protein
MTAAEREALFLVADLLDTIARERHEDSAHRERYSVCNASVCAQARRAAHLAAMPATSDGREVET